MRKLVGLDLGGWRDAACRNWRVVEGAEAEGEHLVEGPVGAVTVRRDDGTWIGGPQAALAPHGLGGGWGEIGRAPRLAWPAGGPASQRGRRGAETPCGGVGRALDALAPRPDVAVLAIDDDGEGSEAEREALLSALAEGGARRRELAWRPVLAVLGAGDVLAGTERVTVICQGARGLSVQDLRIAPDGGPERRRAGALAAPEAGLEAMLGRTRAAFAAMLADPKDAALCARARTAREVALGLAPEPEIVRRENGTWLEVPAPPAPEIPPLRLGVPEGQPVLLETRCEGALAEALEAAVEAALGQGVIRLDARAVARGGLRAAERVARGLPIFYDFLPMMRTLVRGAGGPEWRDLVGEGELLPAGRIYRTREPARFRVPQGQGTLAIYLTREGDARPRRAAEAVPPAGPGGAEVALVLEQQPAAGQARLTLTSRTWPGPVRVDWEAAAPDDRTPEEIAEDERRSLPAPERMVLRAEPDAWRANRPLSRALLRRGGFDWTELKGIVPLKHRSEDLVPDGEGGWRPAQGYAVDSDGIVPEGASALLAEAFDAMLAEGARLVDAAARRGAALPDGALNVLTWSFRRCPAEVRAHVAAALRAHNAGRRHPLLRSNVTLLRQGLGRISDGAAAAREALEIALGVPDEGWNAHVFALAGFVLARTEAGPAVLSRAEVERLARLAIADLATRGRDATAQSLLYPPLVLGGLLRLREAEREALDPERDPLAREMLEAVRALTRRLEPARRQSGGAARKLPVLEELARLIEGQGGGAGLLSALLD